MASEEKYYYTSCKEMKLDHDTGVLSYNSPLSIPVAQFIGPKPFSDKMTKFGVEIVNTGERRGISIGICPDTYPSNKKPGLDEQSIGYQGKDAIIYLNTKFLDGTRGGPFVAGNTIECEFLVKERKVTFYKNGQQVFQTICDFEPSQCFPIVSMHSEGESVKLLEKDPWITLELLNPSFEQFTSNMKDDDHIRNKWALDIDEPDRNSNEWRVERDEQKPESAEKVSGECAQEKKSGNYECSDPRQDNKDGSQMSTKANAMVQEARVTDDWNECNICESKDNIVSKCMECNDILCQICENKHKKGRKSKDHTLLPFAERKNEQEYKKLFFCAEHDFEDFVRYCTKCDKLVCTDCMQGDHAGHLFSKIDVIASDKLKQLETVDQNMADCFSILSDAQIQEYEELVAQRANHFIELIRANEKKILSELENIKADGEPLLENCRSSSQITESAIESYNYIRLLADDTLCDLLIKFAEIETPKIFTKEDVDEMFLKDFPL